MGCVVGTKIVRKDGPGPPKPEKEGNDESQSIEQGFCIGSWPRFYRDRLIVLTPQ